MSEAVRVDLREATMTESARLRERTDKPLFLAMDTPPPVRSLLRLTLGNERKAFEVARVIEVVDEAEPERGCYGAWVDFARLVDQDRVGSEHLEPGISGSAGVPAPVVIMNTGEMMLSDAGEDDDVVLTRSERFAPSEDAAPSESATAGEDATSSESAESRDDATSSDSPPSDEGEPSDSPPTSD
jgi:hypothetical protein